MSEPTYEKVFDSIRSSLVPKSQLIESQKEISILKSQLRTTKKHAKKLKSEYDSQKLTIEILRAGTQTLENEKKTFESKFKEVSLKLKQKTHEYDSLLQMTRTGRDSIIVEETTAQCQKNQEEPQAIGIVSIPAPSTSPSDEPGVKTRGERGITARDNGKRNSTKRRITTKMATHSHASKQSTVVQRNFSCEMCLLYWGYRIDCNCDFDDDQNGCGVPHPKTEIPTFTTFKQYKDHFYTAHDEYSQEQIDNGCYQNDNFCQEKSCLESFEDPYQPVHTWPHGDINCAICGLSFELMEHHDTHIKVEHANINLMSKKEVFDLFQFSSTKFSESS